MTAPTYQPLFHRFAVATACVALLPIGIGALVTTVGAGMAFLDWPSSDGQNMLLYPWLRDLTAGRHDKFVEHGHRLAGMVIGLMSIGLTAIAWWKEPRRSVRIAATLVLLGVIVQGLLGGMRVLADDPRMAMVHGGFAALVFTLMCAVALVTSRSWLAIGDGNMERKETTPSLQPLKALALATPVVILAQYVLGGLLRHLGTALHEHIAVAFVVLLSVLATVVAAHRSRVSWLRRPASLMLAALVAQLALGVGAWVTRFGFASAGYVAVHHSTGQIVLRTSHTVVGMLLFMASVLLALRVCRFDAAVRGGRSRPEPLVAPVALLPTAKGGVG